MRLFRRFAILFAASLALGFALLSPAGAWAQEDKVTVFAAASLKNALDDVAAAWKADGGATVQASYAASSALARQIEDGAPADIFLSADLTWMDYVEKAGRIDPATRGNLLGNRIVLVGPSDATGTVELKEGTDLARLLGDGRLAMGNVDSVPAGKYGKAALEKLGLWDSVSGRTAQAENVRAALKYVSTGEAPLGIVYRTDAASDRSVTILGIFPEESHPPIIYPVALLKESASPRAAAFLAFLRSGTARALFEKQGFAVLLPQSN
ncbi:molybdate ABC transporter substrate-binding protein [Rhizobium sp. TRM95111]|uniref:molybdate ABC transporter substrate-binding protein n=1 Tax=Rhizobium alarense TaxID=2846851 RepID=UPI001F189171|nr:molybdate ABC transporter substrate-binding protein [Rhizobium alarense]MCF3640650.1 molybdate ABC transporter substrate-binding protein [Rhizobium alarense]